MVKTHPLTFTVHLAQNHLKLSSRFIIDALIRLYFCVLLYPHSHLTFCIFIYSYNAWFLTKISKSSMSVPYHLGQSPYLIPLCPQTNLSFLYIYTFANLLHIVLFTLVSTSHSFNLDLSLQFLVSWLWVTWISHSLPLRHYLWGGR